MDDGDEHSGQVAAADSPSEPGDGRGAAQVRTGPSGWRLWVLRAVLAFTAPLLALGLLEGALRLFHYGYSPGFFVRLDNHSDYTGNRNFGRTFFPGWMKPEPTYFVLPAEKAPKTCRIFVLGSSAARGFPDPAFSFSRILEVMLRERFPDLRFEVVNTAMVSINSNVILPIARDCVRQQGDIYIAYLGNNEVVGPYGPGTVFRGFSRNLWLMRLGIRVKSLRTGQLISALCERFTTPERKWQGMETFAGHVVAAADPRMEAIYRRFHRNLTDICNVIWASGGRLVLCTVATNIRDTAPFASGHRPDLDPVQRLEWESLYARGVALESERQFAGAARQYAVAAEIDDTFADLHFRWARCLRARGEESGAKQHFIQARDLDALRFRADSRINESIRRVAGEEAGRGIALVDAEQAFAQDPRTPHGLTGDELLYEHVHLNFAGNHLLAGAVYEAVVPLVRRQFPGTPEGSPSLLSEEECAERLALTSSLRFAALFQVFNMLCGAPFINQLNNYEARQRATQSAVALRHALSSEKPADTLKVFERALDRAPEDIYLHFNLGIAERDAGALDAAIAQWRWVLAKVPEHLEALASLGSALTERGDYPEADACVSKVIQLSPRTGKLFHLQGDLLAKQGKLSEAVKAYRTALSLETDLPWTRLQLAAALIKLNDLAGAEAEYREAIRLAPRLADVHFAYAAFLRQQKQTTRAIAEFEEGLKFNPNQTQAHLALAELLTERGDHARAEQHREEAVDRPGAAPK